MVIGAYVEKIRRIGSIAILGLAAKPILDGMVGLRTLKDARACIEGLTAIGHEYAPEFEKELPFRRFFRKSSVVGRMHHVHFVERSNAEWWDRHALFRDYVCSPIQRSRASTYGRLKRDLAERFREDRDAYTDAKTSFIVEMEREAESAF